MKNQTTQSTSLIELTCVNSEEKPKKRSFVLSRKNQKGQVAIFVALIFQVIFVFFALLINVGLLVHHKINLQQSTDLAAYYGAMKQAEMLNVIGHVNFQIRQAWKLMTWRYRILGTFGFNVSNRPGGLTMPITFSADNPPKLTYNSLDQKCPAPINANLVNAPVFCVGHVGFGDWFAPDGGSETACNVSCSTLDMLNRPISALTPTSGTSVPGAGTAGAINASIASANANSAQLCKNFSVINTSQLVGILVAYFREVELKKKNIELLGKNLLADSSKFMALDKKLVKEGSQKTFENNLTEANLKSVSGFKTLNGISSENPDDGQCSNFENTFNLIQFEMLQFFLGECTSGADVMRDEFYKSIHDLLRDRELTAAIGPENAASVDWLLAPKQKFTTGFEKNPWCNVYYGVRASAEPKIPFLPISKVKLNAVSIAKPFGGSIGPSYNVKWDSGATSSNINSDKVDKTLPMLKINPGANGNIKDNIDILPNYSNYVGDDFGLADFNLVAVYHDLLLNRNITNNSVTSSEGKPNGPIGNARFNKPATGWPKLNERLDSALLVNDPAYDPIAISQIPDGNKVNSGMRDLEISVVAPNQFDLTYYSIDPDFYHNYYKGKLDDPAFINTLQSNLNVAPGDLPVIFFRPDYGYTTTLPSIPHGNQYSVRNQLAVVEEVFKKNNGFTQLQSNNINNPDVQNRYFTFIPKSPASLLTGWTFLNLTNEAGYTTFPNAAGTMKFGKCEDTGSAANVNDNYQSLTSASLPPTPGNCITGGRTGYSVKIVSQEALSATTNQGPIGGQNTSGPIRNPIPASFLNF